MLRCPDDAFNALWRIYFKGKLSRLAAHPVANFVLAKALERVSETQLSDVFGELDGTWNKLIRESRGIFLVTATAESFPCILGTSRTGVLRAVVDRASALKSKSSGQLISEVGYLFCAIHYTPDSYLMNRRSIRLSKSMLTRTELWSFNVH